MMELFKLLIPRLHSEAGVQNVDIKIHGNVATILLDRPARRNALNPQLLQDLSTAFSDVHQERRVGSVVLSGKGDHFCSGMDLQVLSEIAEMPQADALPEWLTAWRHLTELYEQMLRFPKPIIAAVDGAAVGAGLGLALAADLIIPSFARVSRHRQSDEVSLVVQRPHCCRSDSVVRSQHACY